MDKEKDYSLGLYFGSMYLFSAYEDGGAVYLNHLSEDDYITMLIHTATCSMGREVIPYTITDPNHIVSHIQMLLGMTYNEREKNELSKYIPGTLTDDSEGGYAFQIPIEEKDQSALLSEGAEEEGNYSMLPVNLGAEWIFREVLKLIYRADNINPHKSIVIGVPQAYRSVQRKIIKEAAEAAGFMKVGLVDDTKAALFAKKGNISNECTSALCICCDYSFSSLAYYKRPTDDNSGWESIINHSFQNISLNDEIKKFVDKVTAEFWKMIPEDAKGERSSSNDISPSIYFKVARLIFTYRDLLDDGNIISLCYGDGDKRRAYKVSVKKEEIKGILDAFGVQLGKAIAALFKEKQDSCPEIRDIQNTCLILSGECFAEPEVQKKIESAIGGQVKEVKVIDASELTYGVCKSHSSYNSSQSSDIEKSMCEEVKQKSMCEEVKQKTIYSIGFLFDRLFEPGKKNFFCLVPKGTTLPFRFEFTNSQGKPRRFRFPLSKEEATLTIYESVDESGGDDINDFRPFKKYTLYRDRDAAHPPQKPPKLPKRKDDEDSDEYYDRCSHTEEYKEYKKKQKMSDFTVVCEMDENSNFKIEFKWADGKEIRFKDKDNSEKAKKRKEEDRRIFQTVFSSRN